jgi:DNA-directed RNA polymerase beta' subunit
MILDSAVSNSQDDIERRDRRIIATVNMSLLSPNEIMWRTDGVNHAILIDTKLTDGLQSLKGTVKDPRLGPDNATEICVTCKNGFSKCLGHPGYIELPFPVPNPFTLNKLNNIMAKILQTVCVNKFCSKFGQLPDFIYNHRNHVWTIEEGINRLKYLHDSLAKHKCEGIKKEGMKCQARPDQNGIVIKSEKTKKAPTFKYRSDSKNALPIDYEEIAEILARIDRGRLKSGIDWENLYLLGFERGQLASHMMLTVFPVSPLSIRRPTFNGVSEVNAEATSQLNRIVKYSNEYRDLMSGGKPNIAQGKFTEVVKEIYDYCLKSDDEMKGNRRATSVVASASGKNGYFRKSTVSTRVGPCGRAPLVPQPIGFPIDASMIPSQITKNIVVPLVVNESNKRIVREYILKGMAKYYTPLGSDKRVVFNSKMLYKYKPREGDIVYIQLYNKTNIILNRPPTLLNTAMSSYNVQTWIESAIGMAVELMPIYQGDCDGDELMVIGGIYRPLMALMQGRMRISQSPIHMSTERATYGLSDIALYFLYDITLDWDSPIPEKFITVLSQFPVCRDVAIEGNTPRSIISSFLPDDFNYVDGTRRIVDNGQIVTDAPLGRRHVGNSPMSIQVALVRQYNRDIASMFISRMSTLVHFHANLCGASIGMSSFKPPTDMADARIRHKLRMLRDKMSDKLKELGEMDVSEISKILRIPVQISNSISNEFASFVNTRSEPSMKMIKSGTKGNMNTIERIAYGAGTSAHSLREIWGTKRSEYLSYFSSNDLTPANVGYISHGFAQGLSPKEFICNSIDGRHAIVVKHSTTGVVGDERRQMTSQIGANRAGPNGEIRSSDGRILGQYDGYGLHDNTINTINGYKVRSFYQPSNFNLAY